MYISLLDNNWLTSQTALVSCWDLASRMQEKGDKSCWMDLTEKEEEAGGSEVLHLVQMNLNGGLF